MSAVETDVEALQMAMRSLFQTLKRPNYWGLVMKRSGVELDRPAAVILHLLVSHDKSLRVQDVADHLGIEAPSVTRKTQELEKSGFLKRVPLADDKRVVTLHITPKGRKANKQIWKVQHTMLADVLRHWTAKEREQFIAHFARFSDEFAHRTASQAK
jgi:DNA-binding MarR family transcriptional regulator